MDPIHLGNAVNAVNAKRRGKRKYGATLFVIFLGVSILCWLTLIDPNDTPTSPPWTKPVRPLRTTSPIATVTALGDASTTAVTVVSPKFDPATFDFYGLSSDLADEIVLSSANRLHLVRCSDLSPFNSGAVTLTEEGVSWTFDVRRDARSLIVTASRTCANWPRSPSWTADAELERLAQQGVFGTHWIEAHLVGTTVGSATSTTFLKPVVSCGVGKTTATYAGRLFAAQGQYRVLGHLLFSRFEHLNEMTEDAAWHYAISSAETSNLVTPAGDICVVVPNATTVNANSRRGGVRWFAQGLYKENDKRGSLSGYWLPVKGEAADPSVPYFTHDILGRMNYGFQYRNDALTPARGSCDRQCFLTLLRHRTIYFIGDSHMRILFYGFLARLRIPFPANKIWRGDRTDYIASHNVTVKFVASYFLNLSRPSAMSALQDASTPVVVAGVGQHHTCHCWTLKKHLSVMHSALRELLGLKPIAGDATTQQKRKLLWFGIPAQPVNRHLHIPKPVGQSRRDCRNNARHLIFNEAQRSVVRQYSSESDVRFVDGFARSVGMTHTSLDGAHYYTWVRDAWIDDIAEALSNKD